MFVCTVFTDYHHHIHLKIHNVCSNIYTHKCVVSFLADPGKARGCSTNSLVIHSFSQWVSEPFPPTALQRCHAQTVRDSSFSYKIYYVIVIKNVLNLKGHQNPKNGSKGTALLLQGWILPIGWASAVEGLQSTGLPRLVYMYLTTVCYYNKIQIWPIYALLMVCIRHNLGGNYWINLCKELSVCSVCLFSSVGLACLVCSAYSVWSVYSVYLVYPGYPVHPVHPVYLVYPVYLVSPTYSFYQVYSVYPVHPV